MYFRMQESILMRVKPSLRLLVLTVKQLDVLAAMQSWEDLADCLIFLKLVIIPKIQS